MRLKSLLSAALVSLSTAAFAQIGQWTNDSVALGVGYANDVFYDINQGTTTLRSGSDWDLAFETFGSREPMFNAAIRANHVKKGLEVYTLGMSASANWSTLTPADTVGKTLASLALINNDTSWGTSAFYQNRLVTDPFSFGWGDYSINDHSITGDQLYLLKMGGNAYKFWCQKFVSTPLDSISYTFRIAKLDGTDDNLVKFYTKASGFTDRIFAYYDIATNTLSNREPVRTRWDLLFTQYRQLISAGPSGMVPYNLTGVLSNVGLEVADVRQLNADDVTDVASSTTYFKKFTRTIHTDEVGADWKTYVNPGPSGYYKMTDSLSYIVKSVNSSYYWQLKFTRFDGGGATGMGKIVFAKRYLGNSVGISTVAAQSLNAFTVAPNPAAADATIVLDAKKAASAQMIVTDMAGRVVKLAALDLKSGVNAFSLSTTNWATGTYAIQVAAQDWKVSTRLAVTH